MARCLGRLATSVQAERGKRGAQQCERRRLGNERRTGGDAGYRRVRCGPVEEAHAGDLALSRPRRDGEVQDNRVVDQSLRAQPAVQCPMKGRQYPELDAVERCWGLQIYTIEIAQVPCQPGSYVTRAADSLLSAEGVLVTPFAADIDVRAGTRVRSAAAELTIELGDMAETGVSAGSPRQ
jgi:hypothetical protein